MYFEIHIKINSRSKKYNKNVYNPTKLPDTWFSNEHRDDDFTHTSSTYLEFLGLNRNIESDLNTFASF